MESINRYEPKWDIMINVSLPLNFKNIKFRKFKLSNRTTKRLIQKIKMK